MSESDGAHFECRLQRLFRRSADVRRTSCDPPSTFATCAIHFGAERVERLRIASQSALRTLNALAPRRLDSRATDLLSRCRRASSILELPSHAPPLPAPTDRIAQHGG